MAQHFDKMEAWLHRITTRKFGYLVSWLPSFGGDAIVKLAHIKDPNKWGEIHVVEKVDYGQQEPILEYFDGDFPGLMESVNNGGTETITTSKGVLNEVFTYRVASANRIHDGQTIMAILVSVESL